MTSLFAHKYKIIPDVIQFCLQSSFFARIEPFLKLDAIDCDTTDPTAAAPASTSASNGTSAADSSNGNHSADPHTLAPPAASKPTHRTRNSISDKFEYSLGAIDHYNQYIHEFEGQLETFITSHGYTTEKFYELCREVNTTLDPGSLDAFLQLLEMMTEFEAFVDMTRDPQKRHYVRQVLKGYAQMLSAQQQQQSDAS